MNDLIQHYERELALLRRSMATFATRYPKAAARLGITGDHCDDPHVERLLQSFALVAAGISNRIEDHYPEFAESLIGAAYPQYLRPVPACAMVRFDVADVVNQITAPSIVPRGATLAGKTHDCHFRTVYDVALAPVLITQARYAPATTAPAGARLPADTDGLLSITFAAARAEFQFDAIPSLLRVHVQGPEQVASATIDTMMLRVAGAFVEGTDHRWTALDRVPLAPVGADPAQRLIEEDDARQPLRLLFEYFAFAPKFNFVDVDLRSLVRVAGHGQSLTLHLAIRDVHPDSQTAQRLKSLAADDLVLFCTPVVNLFRMASVPLKRAKETGRYIVPLYNTDVASSEVWSVDVVRAPGEKREPVLIEPFVSLRHGSAAKANGPYWVLVRPDEILKAPAQAKVAVDLVGLDGRPVAYGGIDQLMADIIYSNGERPRAMRFGADATDLLCEANVLGARIVMLAQPTLPKRLALDGESAWRLIAQLAPQTTALTRTGLDELRRLLRQFATPYSGQFGLIDALKNLSHKPVHLWLQGEPMPSIVRGIEIKLTVDEQAFATATLSAMTSAMEVFLAQHVPEINFIQLVVISFNTGVELRRCAPRRGTRPLV
jgi:type VI secretion system protein ImpG